MGRTSAPCLSCAVATGVPPGQVYGIPQLNACQQACNAGGWGGAGQRPARDVSRGATRGRAVNRADTTEAKGKTEAAGNGKTEAKGKKRRGRGEGSIEPLPDGRWRAILSLGIDPATGKRV